MTAVAEGNPPVVTSTFSLVDLLMMAQRMEVRRIQSQTVLSLNMFDRDPSPSTRGTSH